MRANFNEGEGGHIYRSVYEIKADIRRVMGLIEEINSMINIRDMLMNMLSDAASDAPSEWLEDLCELVDGAREGLNQLCELEQTLEQLKEELSYTVAAVL